MIGDDVLQKISGQLSQQNPEQMRQQLEDNKKQSVDIDKYGQNVAGVMHLLWEEQKDSSVDNAGLNTFFDKISDSFFEEKGFLKQLDQLAEEIKNCDDIDSCNKLIKRQKEIVKKMKEDLKEVGEVVGVDVDKMVDEEYEKLSEPDDEQTFESELTRGLQEVFYNNEEEPASNEFDFEDCDGAYNAFGKYVEDIKTKYENNKYLQNFVGVRFGQVTERKDGIEKIKNDKKKQKELEILKKDIEIIMQEIQEKIQEIQKNSERKKQVKEKDEQIVEDAIKEYGEFVENIDEKYTKLKAISIVLGKIDKLIKNDKGIVKMQNVKTRAKKVQQFQKNVKEGIDKIKQIIDSVDNFNALVKEFGRTGTIYQDVNGVDVLEVVKYNVKDDLSVVYKINNEEKQISVEEFRKIIADKKRKSERIELDEGAYNEIIITAKINYKDNKDLQKLVKNIEKSVSGRKKAIEKIQNIKQKNHKIQELQKYLGEVILQIAGVIDDVENADDEQTAKDGKVLKERQEKRKNRFENFYGIDQEYHQYGNEVQLGFVTDRFILEEYRVGEYPRHDRVIIDHNGLEKTFTVKEFKKFLKENGFIRFNADKSKIEKKVEFYGTDKKYQQSDLDEIVMDDNKSEGTKSEADKGEKFNSITMPVMIAEEIEDFDKAWEEEEQKKKDDISNRVDGDTLTFGDNDFELENVDTQAEGVHDLKDAGEDVFKISDDEGAVTEADETKKIRLDGVEDFSGSEREILENVFDFAQIRIKRIDQSNEKDLQEFINDLQREFVEEYSIVQEQKLQKMMRVILDNLNIDSQQFSQISQKNEVEKNDAKETEGSRIDKIRKEFGQENMKILMDRVDSFYHKVKDGASWDNYDDMEREEELEKLTEEFIINTVTMIDGGFAQQFTQKDLKEVYKYLLSLE